jgi:hypothetical protein
MIAKDRIEKRREVKGVSDTGRSDRPQQEPA